MNFDIFELDENILVYRGAFPDPIGFIESVEKLDGWHDWYTFGRALPMPGSRKLFDKFPTKEEWEEHLFHSAKVRETRIVEEIFYEVTKDYIERTGFHQDNWEHSPPSMCKYFPDFSVHEDLVMHYHTDYQQENADAPGSKFSLTCTMYLNDDYSGGEISFKIFDENDETYRKIEYKPNSGDILVFPSTPPYYHGVKTVKDNYKYFLRTFWWRQFEGTQEWFDNQNKYGKEKWEEMEKERWKEEYRSKKHTRSDY